MNLLNIFRRKKKVIEPAKPLLKPAKHLTGQTIYQLDLETLDITEAPGDQVEQLPGYWYCAALNKKNAERHFLKMVNANTKNFSNTGK